VQKQKHWSKSFPWHQPLALALGIEPWLIRLWALGLEAGHDADV